MNTLGVVVSTSHLALKFPISLSEAGVVHVDKKEARHCYNESLKRQERNKEDEGHKKFTWLKLINP